MKKIISIFLTATLVLTNFQGWDYLKQVKLFENFDLFQGIEKSYASEENTTDDGIRYYINNNAVVIAGVEDGISGDVVIPESIDGYPVTIIEENAFSDNDSITSIVIPEGVKQIEYAAFKSCSSLTKVDMPSTLKTIGMLAFQDCKSLKSIKIPEGLEDIGTYTFWYCTSLSNIELPGSLATIGDYAFIGCGSLVNVSIPEGVQKIGANAFLNCTSLIKIEIPKSVNSIDDTAFEGSTIKAGGIYGYTGTYAETYANEKGIPFYIIGKDTELALNLEKHTKEEIKQYVSQNVNLSQNIT